MRWILLVILSVIALECFPVETEESIVKQATIEYLDAYYASDIQKFEKIVYPEISVAQVTVVRRTGRTTIAYTSYSQLIESVRAKQNAVEKSKRAINPIILGMKDDVAVVKVTSFESFIDYMHLVKINNTWKVITILHVDSKILIPGIKADNDKGLIAETVRNYSEGYYAADPARIEMSMHKEFNRIQINKNQQTSRITLARQRYQGAIEAALAKQNKFDEKYRHFALTVYEQYEGYAFARVDYLTRSDFLQFIKTDGEWKVITAIVLPKNDLVFDSFLPAIANEPMSDFTLPVYGGGEFTLSKLKGKNVLILFPRGWLGNVWCPYCPYHYLELAEMVRIDKIKEKYNLEIVFVMPYSEERITDWFNKMPDALATIEQLKTIPEPRTQYQNDIVSFAKRFFPKQFTVDLATVKKSLPVLVDADRTLSKKLQIFTNFWDGVSSEQNIPLALIIDKNGIVKLKYESQITEDRPSVEYLLEIVKTLQ